MNEGNDVLEVLNFWFGALTKGNICRHDKQRLWWSKSLEMDHYIRNKFGKYLGSARSGYLSHWLETPRGTLAYIIVVDQFSRHIFRNSQKAYSQDELALKACLEGIENGFDKELHTIERSFFYMPLMHSEDFEMQQLSMKKFSELAEKEVPDPDLHELLLESKKYAKHHFNIIERFGRFPHRNQFFGRESTPQEEEFLKQPGSSF